MKKRIFVNIHYLEIGGAERALLGLLSALDPYKVDVDLFVNQHTGEFMSFVPDYVNLLPEIPEYTCIERPIKDIVKEGHVLPCADLGQSTNIGNTSENCQKMKGKMIRAFFNMWQMLWIIVYHR